MIQDLLFGDKERDQWIQSVLATFPKNSRLLDAGAGQCKNKQFCDDFQYISQDFCEYKGGAGAGGIQKEVWDTSSIDIVSDIIAIPEPDESFDAILCIAVIEHIPRPDLALKEFYRLLKDGGTLILSAPFASTTHFAPYHYYSGFTRFFYEKYLDDLDFKEVTIEPNGNFFDFMAATLSQLPLFIDNFTADKIHFDDTDSIQRLVSLMQSASLHQKGADELLNFGYNIKAVK